MSSVQNRKAGAACASEIEASVSEQLQNYLQAIMSSFNTEPETGKSTGDDMCNTIFRLLTNRRYNYLSRSGSAEYQGQVFPWIEQAVMASEPLPFYYDLGGGYHASVRPGEEELTFTVGLGELLALRQIVRFNNDLRSIYSPGVRFSIVIDNLCAYFTNDISLELTSGYVDRFRRLITQLELDDCIELLVEAELTSIEDFRHEFMSVADESPASHLSSAEHENVERFLGRLCTPEEAEERVARYRRADTATERLLAPMIRGIRLTQRATPQTLCFRSFPGGDQRIQSGDVAVVLRGESKPQPALLTCRNAHRFQWSRVPSPACLPADIRDVTVATPL